MDTLQFDSKSAARGTLQEPRQSPGQAKHLSHKLARAYRWVRLLLAP